jgi:hypothetical protein
MIGTNWDGIAHQLGFKDGKSMFQKYYLGDGMSLDELAKRFNVSPGMIRTHLAKLEIPLKQRGGANYRKIVVTADLVADCAKRGSKLVAAELGVSYTALHKALKRFSLAQQTVPAPVLHPGPLLEPTAASPQSEESVEEAPAPESRSSEGQGNGG